MNKINKPELVAAVATKTGLSKTDTSIIVDTFLGEVTKVIASGEKVHLHGFGDFSTTERAARKGRNPQSGKELDIAATTRPKFKAAKALKDAVK